jgi:predicted TIM-barrel fold metal-dependent hydrolase
MTQQDARDPAASGWDCHVHVFDPAAPRLAGHYAPAPAPIEDIERVAAEHGVDHLVLVQPSVYGTDNSVLERALLRSRGRHRGVAVLGRDTSEAQIDLLHEAGVRGVRFNLVSPVGNGDEALEVLAPALHRRGWHVQWYAHPAQLPRIAELQARTGLVFVLDHLAGLRADASPEPPCWHALERLARAGAWVKLSGWYRLGADAPYDVLTPVIRQVSEIFGRHKVWGSDWPHTSLPAGGRSRMEELLEPVRTALGAAELDRCLQDYPRVLYAG